MSTPGNSINETTTGITGFTGTGFVGSQTTQYNVLVGSSTTSTLTNVAPSATTGVPLISQGSSSNPAFGTAVVAGGGTGVTSNTAYSVLCGGTTSTGAIQSIASVGTSGQVLTSNGAGALPTWQAASGGSKPSLNLYFKASDFDVLEANFAPLVQDNGTNARVLVRAFDDTTVEYVNFSFGVPGDVDTAGTVTFRVWMYAATATASKNVELEFEHRAIDNSESWDQTYTAENSGDISIDATQDDITEATWTETISNLGWAANDLILAKLSRTQPSANDLSGDLYIIGFRVEIPRT